MNDAVQPQLMYARSMVQIIIKLTVTCNVRVITYTCDSFERWILIRLMQTDQNGGGAR